MRVSRLSQSLLMALSCTQPDFQGCLVYHQSPRNARWSSQDSPPCCPRRYVDAFLVELIRADSQVSYPERSTLTWPTWPPTTSLPSHLSSATYTHSFFKHPSQTVHSKAPLRRSTLEASPSFEQLPKTTLEYPSSLPLATTTSFSRNGTRAARCLTRPREDSH